MRNQFDSIEKAIGEFSQGLPIVVVDDETRENEGDIIIPASLASAELINFCIVEARGLLCVAIDETIADRLNLRKVRTNHKDSYHTAFLDSVDATAIHGVSTGISASDRATTARLLANPTSTAADFSTPGHLFPLLAVPNGVLSRSGHTEAGVDLCKLANLPPAALICEILGKDGTMLRRVGLRAFANQHNLSMISIADLKEFRKAKEQSCFLTSSANLPTTHGLFKVQVYCNRLNGLEHILIFNDKNLDVKPLVRVHSECVTGDILGSTRCDCGDQLNEALRLIQEHGHGYLLYIKGHEGRGIGLSAKIAAYALQEEGMNTYEANQALGYHPEQRDFTDAIQILRQLGLSNFILLSNNPFKIEQLRKASFTFSVEGLQTPTTIHNRKYLTDKKTIGKHAVII